VAEEWPDSLDAVVAAGDFHKLRFEDDEVRVLETRIGPGETTPIHTHRWPSIIYVLSTAHFIRRDADGTLLSDTRETGTLPEAGACFAIPAIPPHTVENVDDGEILMLNIELKRG
jgi:hypothetical protein